MRNWIRNHEGIDKYRAQEMLLTMSVGLAGMFPAPGKLVGQALAGFLVSGWTTGLWSWKSCPRGTSSSQEAVRHDPYRLPSRRISCADSVCTTLITKREPPSARRPAAASPTTRAPRC
jgi:hypothetical protein